MRRIQLDRVRDICLCIFEAGPGDFAGTSFSFVAPVDSLVFSLRPVGVPFAREYLDRNDDYLDVSRSDFFAKQDSNGVD